MRLFTAVSTDFVFWPAPKCRTTVEFTSITDFMPFNRNPHPLTIHLYLFIFLLFISVSCLSWWKQSFPDAQFTLHYSQRNIKLGKRYTPYRKWNYLELQRFRYLKKCTLLDIVFEDRHDWERGFNINNNFCQLSQFVSKILPSPRRLGSLRFISYSERHQLDLSFHFFHNSNLY